MFCESCGHSLNPSDKFCTGCGAPVSRPDSVTTVVQRNDGQETIVAEGESLINGVSESSLSDDHEETDATPADTSDDGDATDTQPERINTVSDGMNDANASDDVNNQDNDDGNQSGARRRRTRIAVGIVSAVVAVILIAVAAVMVVPRLLGGTGGAEQAEYRNVVYYGSSKASKVRPSTTIVLYGDDGEPLDKYDVTVMDESGEVTTTHVTDGEFTPAEVGAEPGDTY